MSLLRVFFLCYLYWPKKRERLTTGFTYRRKCKAAVFQTLYEDGTYLLINFPKLV